ncbi:MAG TPA: hypothetical protein VI454_06095 [Verrucomicrobiae bacterium]
MNDLIELQSAILEIQQKQAALFAENQSLAEENKRLVTAASITGYMKFVSPVYRISGRENMDGDYCQACYDSQHKLVRVHYFRHQGASGWKCKVCEKIFYDR